MRSKYLTLGCPLKLSFYTLGHFCPRIDCGWMMLWFKCSTPWNKDMNIMWVVEKFLHCKIPCRFSAYVVQKLKWFGQRQVNDWALTMYLCIHWSDLNSLFAKSYNDPHIIIWYKNVFWLTSFLPSIWSRFRTKSVKIWHTVVFYLVIIFLAEAAESMANSGPS